MNELYHPIQLDILNKLLFNDFLFFSDLKPFSMEGSKFTFHLHKLEELNLISKDSKGAYLLTDKGKLAANSIDTDSPFKTKQAKLSVVFVASRNNDSQVLIYKRLKNPFYGCIGFPAGKVRYGESILDGASRELKEETNLTGIPILKAIRHFRVYQKETKELLEDKVMYIHLIQDPTGELESNKEGEFKWVNVSDISKEVTNPLEEFNETFELLFSKSTKELEFFKEVNQYTLKF